MKKIGIILRDDYNLNFREFKVMNKEVFDYLEKISDITVIGIAVDFNCDKQQEFNKVKEIIDLCDGFILQGGDDPYPIDIMICKYLYEKDIPTLGICLGMQTMGLALNGEFSDLKLISHKSNEKYVHEVILNNKSKLYEIVKNDKIKVNSRHKDYLIKTDLDIVGISNDGIIEAIECKNKRFFIGIEWHPESLRDEPSDKLFKAFINSL